MNYDELSKKYRALLAENKSLREKIKKIEAQVSVYSGTSGTKNVTQNNNQNNPGNKLKIVEGSVNRFSPAFEKIVLFQSLFKGREDVFATRWENSKKGISGYSPACGNEWVPGICQKPKIKCSACKNKDYLEPDNAVIEDHLRGKTVAGIYPLLPDETCWFLAIDFDGEEWQQDIKTIRKVCAEFSIPVAVERSRSGDGCHAWFFFEQPVSAAMARKFRENRLILNLTRMFRLK